MNYKMGVSDIAKQQAPWLGAHTKRIEEIVEDIAIKKKVCVERMAINAGWSDLNPKDFQGLVLDIIVNEQNKESFGFWRVVTDRLRWVENDNGIDFYVMVRTNGV